MATLREWVEEARVFLLPLRKLRERWSVGIRDRKGGDARGDVSAAVARATLLQILRAKRDLLRETDT